MPAFFAPALSAPRSSEREAVGPGLGDDDGQQPATSIRLSSSLLSQFKDGLRTAGDAYQLCSALFAEQLDRALVTKPAPNQPIPGDSAARSAFLLLLSDAQQRDLFLHTATVAAHWPRLKPLVGAPPYQFLRPQDASVLNASGFAKGRANMTYDTPHRIANHHQFGNGQLIDEHTREYRIAPLDVHSDDLLPGSEYLRNAKDVMLHVKVKKHSIEKKRQLLNSSFKKQLFFPQVGEIIVLRESSALMSARGLLQASPTVMKVKALWPRGQGASTAAVRVGL